MEKRVSGAFAAILEKNRHDLNARFTAAKQLHNRVSPADFLDFLAGTLAPTVDRAAKTDPEKAETLCLELYDLSLRLFGMGLLGPGARHPAVNAAWKTLFPEIAGFLSRKPHETAASVTNAVYNLSLENGADPLEWIETMCEAVSACPDTETLLATGKAAAWRCGMAHFRDSALSACDSLSDKVFRIVFRISDRADNSELETIRALLKQYPWFDPSVESKTDRAPLAIVNKVGGFAGNGGAFVTPPDVTVINGDMCLHDDQRCMVLHADAFGATLHKRGDSPPGGPVSDCSPFVIRRDGVIENEDAVNVFPELADFKSAAATPHFLAVCVPRSHYAFLVARKRGFRHAAE